MDLPTFAKALVLVGAHVYGISPKDAKNQLGLIQAMCVNTLNELDRLISESERGMNTNASTQIAKLLEILQDESIVNVLNIVHKTMLPFYQFYANSRLQMNFEGFQKFCVDFGIFPDILSKPKIYRFFKTLANFY